jgi:glycine dehydrogenase subunit 1
MDALTDKAHAHGALAIALVNPLALALLKAPGQWGARPHPNPLDEPTSHSTRLQTSAAKSLVIPQAGEGANVSLRDSKIYGADIAVGEGQPLGIPLSSGGPYFGFLCCKQALVRQMPGRIVGRTVDLDGKQGFTLTLQAREQHIRRAKATSNICSNQGLMATAATIHMALLGSDGLRRTAAASHANTAALVALAENLPGVKRIFFGPYFHEAVLQLPESPASVLDKMLAQGVLGGLDLSGHYPQLGNAVLVCATETKTATDLQRYVDTLKLSLTNQENRR